MESVGTIEGTVIINGGEPVRAVLTSRQEMIEYRSNIATKPDLRWEATDAAGHFHAYDEKGVLPTLENRPEQVPCDGACGDSGCEGTSISHWHCVICGEEMKPSRVPDHYGVTPGRRSIGLTAYARVPQEPVSFRFTSGEREWFGFGEKVSAQATGYGDVTRWETELACWRVGQRKELVPVRRG